MRHFTKRPTGGWQTKLIIGLLIAFGVVLYCRWFNFGIFTYGDWSYKHIGTLKDALQMSTWIGNNGFGSFDELVWRAPFNFLFGLFAAFDIPINVSEKFIVFIPIAITSLLAPYLLVWQITKNRLASVFGALFYATNTYFLAINPQGHQLLTLAGNILTLAFALWMRALEGTRYRLYVATALLLWLTSIVDFRLFYIGVLLFAGYLLYWRLMTYGMKALPIRQLLIFGGITGLLQVGWLAATVMSGGSSSGDAVLSRSLFGSEYWDLASALTLHHPFWTGTTTSWFIYTGVPLLFWLIPIGVCAALIIERKNTQVVFFAVVAVLGILLSKQTSQPFGALYPFLFENLPGFNAFRESTKFYYLVALGYTVVLAALIVSLANMKGRVRFSRPLYITVLVIIGGMALLNALPYITGSMNKLLTPRTMPADYARIADKLDKDQGYYRTLWVPIAPRWSYFSSTHPRVNATNLVSIAAGHASSTGNYDSPAEQLSTIIASPLFKQYLQSGAVKYVFVPLRDTANQDDFFQFYGDDRQFYIDALDNVSFLSRVDMGLKDVVVYQNKTYQPYISATSNVYSLPQNTDLESLLTFVGSQTTAPLNIQLAGKNTPSPPSHVAADVFGGITPGAIHKGTLTSERTLPQGGSLHLGNGTADVSYAIADGILHVAAAKQVPLLVDGQPLNLPGQSESAGEVPLHAQRTYFAHIDDRIIPLDIFASNRQLGAAKKNVTILSTDNRNLLANGSFESGQWQPDVGDCNPYDARPGIAMMIDNATATDGEQSLELDATRHIACTASSSMEVQGGTQYMVRFDYKAPYAKRISFAVSFDGKTEVKHVFTNSGTQDWRTAHEVITVPKNATHLTLYLYGLPPANHSFNTEVATTHFDAVAVLPLTTESEYAPSDGATLTPLPLAAGKHTFSYTSPSVTGQNLVTNGSLEQGLWQKKPQKCDDLESKPDISMRSSSTASAGSTSLELSARGRVACTGPEAITVQENGQYVLSFAHQSPNNVSASFSISFNDPGKTSIGDQFATATDWQTYNRIITVPAGATQARLKVYVQSNETQGIVHTNRYDNFQLFAIPPATGRFYILSEHRKLQPPQKMSFTSYNQTKKIVHVSQAKGPFYLTLAESYSSSWRVALTNSKIHGPLHSWWPLAKGDAVQAHNHIRLDTHLNGWYIDPRALCSDDKAGCTLRADGSYDIELTIEYVPQRWFTVGLVVLCATLAGAVGFLLLRREKLNGWRAP